MNLDVPKPFLFLEGKPIFVRAIEPFQEAYPDIKVVVILPYSYLELGERYIQEYCTYPQNISVISGGESRTLSVWNGLTYLHRQGVVHKYKSLVAIHDAARPLLTPHLVKKTFFSANTYDSGISVVPIAFAIRKKNKCRSYAIDREKYWEVQTPQVFNFSQIWEAYQNHYQQSFYDDATLYEEDGFIAKEVTGEVTNIKVTYPHDFAIACHLWKLQQQNTENEAR